MIVVLLVVQETNKVLKVKKKKKKNFSRNDLSRTQSFLVSLTEFSELY